MSGVGEAAGIPPSGASGRLRVVLEHEHEHPSHWVAIGEVAEKLGVERETLRA